MELRHLRYFITVAEELSFSKAAIKLHTAQPSLSQQIKDLEDEIGVQLFHRTKRKVELTDEGHAFLEQARLTITQADKAVTMARQVAAAKVQCLRIDSFLQQKSVFSLYFATFTRENSKTTNLYTQSKRNWPNHWIKKGDLDIIFINQDFQNDTFASQLVLKEPLVFMLPKQHPFAKFEEIKLEQLKELELTILSNKLSQPLSKTILQYIEFNKIQFKTIHETNHIVDCIQAVNSGVSCAICHPTWKP